MSVLHETLNVRDILHMLEVLSILLCSCHVMHDLRLSACLEDMHPQEFFEIQWI